MAPAVWKAVAVPSLKALQLTAFAEDVDKAPNETASRAAARVEITRFIITPFYGIEINRCSRVEAGKLKTCRVIVTARTLSKVEVERITDTELPMERYCS